MRTKLQATNQPRAHAGLMLVVLVALLASSIASIAAVAGTAGTSHACSIAGPYAEVWPSTELQPGQKVEIAGWGFYDIRLHEPVPPVAPNEPDLAVPPELCDFDMVPMANLDVYWHGASSSWLGSVAGPDFTLSVAVPNDAAPGPAWISVGPVELAVSVGGFVEPPPPPCPLAVQPGDSDRDGCPEPWPCPLYGAGDTQPAPAADYAPGFQPPCPEPCVDYAHTIDDGTVYDYRWDCPDPCSQTQVSPGAGDEALAVWCPPPDPCPLYPNGAEISKGCPDPCPVYFEGSPAPDVALIGCPDPCAAVGGDAVWCPPPDPCPFYANWAEIGTGCPDPCPVYFEGSPAPDVALIGCPDPCPLFTASASDTSEALVWCPPDCQLVGGDALVCPEPCADPNVDPTWSCAHPEPAQASPPTAAVVPESAAVPVVTELVEPTQSRAATAATNIVEAITNRLLETITGFRLTFFS